MDSQELERRLLNAADIAAELGYDYMAAWHAVRTAKINRDLTRADVVATAYVNGDIDGKNAEQRAAQLDAMIASNLRLASHEDSLRGAEARLKDADTALESARVYRAALHDLVALRVAELGVEAATGRRTIAHGTDWRTLKR